MDVAVFCLSLMGTNYSSYIKEAHRVLRPRYSFVYLPISSCSWDFVMILNNTSYGFIVFHSGMLLIAEVKSRFDPNNGGADPKDFVKAVCDLGFTSVLKVQSFLLLFFISTIRKKLIWFFEQDFSNKMFILFHFKKKVSETYFLSGLLLVS